MKSNFQLLSTILICLYLLSGCSSTAPNPLQSVNALNPGMTKAEVITALGQPRTSMSPGNGVEILRYLFIQPRSLLKTDLKTDYLVRLVNGRVEAYGTPRELKPVDPILVISNDKTVNLNIKTDGQTNSVAPVQPNVHINAN